MRENKAIPYLFIAPAILLLFLLCYLPIPYSLTLALSEAENMTGKLHFVGLDNFIALLSSEDFWQSTKNTVLYVATAVTSLIIIGFIMAMIFNKAVKYKAVFLTILMIPWVISEVVTGSVWKWMFNDNFGLLNFLCSPLGIRPSEMLTNDNTAFLVIAMATLWQKLPYAMLIFLSGMQNIPQSYTEAAIIDGASQMKVITKIIIPLLKSTGLVLILLLTVWCINQTGMILVLVSSGYIKPMQTLSVFMYREAFTKFEMSTAAALSFILGFINIAFAMLYIKFNKTDI